MNSKDLSKKKYLPGRLRSEDFLSETEATDLLQSVLNRSSCKNMYNFYGFNIKSIKMQP